MNGRSWPGGEESRLNVQSIVKICKKSGACLITAKVQTHLGSSEIDISLRKIQNISTNGAATKRELICVSQVVYYLCGVLCLAFDFAFR
jgi:hypothetical protein